MFAAVLSVAACVFAIYVAALCLRFARAPGWEDRRWFAAVALTGAAFSAADIPIEMGTTDVVVRFNSLLQLLFGCLHLVAWISYAAGCVGREPGRVGRGLQIALAAVGLSVFIPGSVYPGPVRSHTFAPLELTYREPEITAYGGFVLAVLLLGFLGLAVFYAIAWRRHVRDAGAHLVALVLVLAMAVSDALTVEGIISLPYFTDFAFALPTFAVSYAITKRFAEDARSLSELRLRLEALVDARTHELEQTQAALVRAERLAALGEVAAGVGHEVNNPMAVVIANMSYLAGAVARGEPSDEILAAVSEAQEASQRVSQIVRQLLNAGRLAAAMPVVGSVDLDAVVQEAIALARPACSSSLRFESQVASGLAIVGQQDTLAQALANLMIHVARASPERDGLVRVSAQAAGSERVQLTVAPDRTGPPAPPRDVRSDLGLAVARQLIQSSRGELRLEESRLLVELPLAAPKT